MHGKINFIDNFAELYFDALGKRNSDWETDYSFEITPSYYIDYNTVNNHALTPTFENRTSIKSFNLEYLIPENKCLSNFTNCRDIELLFLNVVT